MKNTSYTKKELLNLLKKKGKELGRTPKRREFNNSENLGFVKIFGTYNNAVKLAGFKPNGQCPMRKYSQEILLKLIKKKYKESGKIPSKSDMDKSEGYPNSVIYYVYFKSWNEAVKLAGFKPRIKKNKEIKKSIFKRLFKR